MNSRSVNLSRIAAIVALIAPLVGCQPESSQTKFSEFGKYQGYSRAIYDGTQRASDFLILSDGTRLAYDLFLPTKEGVPAGEPLPALFLYTPYDRA